MAILEPNNVTEGERVMYNVYIMSGYVTEGERVMYNVYIMSGYVMVSHQGSSGRRDTVYHSP